MRNEIQTHQRNSIERTFKIIKAKKKKHTQNENISEFVRIVGIQPIAL